MFQVFTLLCLVMLASAQTGRAQAPRPEPQVPPGFQLVLEAPGVQLFKKDYPQGTPDFVQVVDLSQGASIKLLHGKITEAGEGEGVYGGDNPRFKRQSLETFWNSFAADHPTAFCMTNGQFFYLPEDPTRIAFPLKVDGNRISDGYGIQEYPEQKLMLELWDGYADIRELSPQTLSSSTAPDILAGLAEEANKREKKYVGRTFIAVDDRNGDGLYETLLIFTTLSARQVDAVEVLRNFGADKVMMLDGGGSAQLICQDKPYVGSERQVPQAVAVTAGIGPAHGSYQEPVEQVQSLLEKESLGENTSMLTIEKEVREARAAIHMEQPVEAKVVHSPSMDPGSVIIIPLAILPISVFLFVLLIRLRRESGQGIPEER